MCAVVRKSRSARKSAFLSIRLEPSVRAELERVAAANDRTLAGEIRVAVRRHLDEAREAA